jgi:hypothetical protein
MKILRALAVVGAFTSCNGTETDNPVESGSGPLVDFASSPCKRETAMSGQQPLSVASEAEGLQCVSWELTESGTLLLRLLNFDAGCGAEWSGRAELADDGAIELAVDNPSCRVASCGTCLYDFDFELADVDTTADLPLRAALKMCPSDDTTYGADVTLPLADSPSGSLCRPIARGPLGWYAITTSRCGAYNMPCGADCMGPSGCDDGLTCVAIDGADDYRCLEVCSADADCSSPLTSCQSETCRPAQTF